MGAIQVVPDLSEQVYQAVLADICDGVLAPGTHLLQEQLAAHYGVSRQPVQQAIALLKADGLVEKAGKRGIRVAPLDLNLMRHHYEIRAALDGVAARRAAERARLDPAVAQDARVRGEALLKAGRDAVAMDAIREQISHDETFHNLIYELSGNPLLPRTAHTHWRFLRRAMGDVLRHAEPPRTIWEQHAEILDAIVAGDPETAESRATEHLRIAADTLTTALDSRG